MSGQGAVRLTEGERGALANVVGWPVRGGGVSALSAAVEAIVAARVANALDEVEEAIEARYVDHLIGNARAPQAKAWFAAREIVRKQRAALTAAPVPPADETEPQAGASGDGGGLG